MRIESSKALPKTGRIFHVLRIFTQHKKFLAFWLAGLPQTNLPTSRLKISLAFLYFNESDNAFFFPLNLTTSALTMPDNRIDNNTQI
jgi:hypothetical protein